jgi:hypothetical protein
VHAIANVAEIFGAEVAVIRTWQIVHLSNAEYAISIWTAIISGTFVSVIANLVRVCTNAGNGTVVTTLRSANSAGVYGACITVITIFIRVRALSNIANVIRAEVGIRRTGRAVQHGNAVNTGAIHAFFSSTFA